MKRLHLGAMRVGIDFGTTNTAVGLASSDGAVALARRVREELLGAGAEIGAFA